MDRKYELLKDDCINYCGKTLYRIKALRDFGGIEAGDIGGYIEKEDNLSHEHNSWVYEHAKVFGNAEVYEDAKVYEHAEVFGSARIQEGRIIGRVSMPYKDIFQHQCENRMLTAILTEDDQILYSIGCQLKITEEEFIDRIHNKDGGLEKNPHREEYLKLIKTINFHFKEKLNN